MVGIIYIYKVAIWQPLQQYLVWIEIFLNAASLENHWFCFCKLRVTRPQFFFITRRIRTENNVKLILLYTVNCRHAWCQPAYADYNNFGENTCLVLSTLECTNHKSNSKQIFMGPSCMTHEHRTTSEWMLKTEIHCSIIDRMKNMSGVWLRHNVV